MCLKPQPPQPIPEATAALMRDLFPEDSAYQFIGDVLFDQFRERTSPISIPRTVD
jgi:hypothetical protein